MSLYHRLIKLKKELGKKALRVPKTKEEIAVRNKYGRVTAILMRRYDYNIDSTMEEYRRQDQIEEITATKRF